MPINFDIETDVLYKRGIEIGEERGKQEGIQIGEERGIEQGIEIGQEKKLEDTITKLIIKKGWSNEEIAETLDVSIALVKSIRAKIRK